ncbi:MAG TPA: hypothetical protein VFK05_18160 [Polyangiaceae bacterium]|nr:hypothetical protein [Polyangiaceae bacterium]
MEEERGREFQPDDARDKFLSAITNKHMELEALADLHATSERIAAELAELQAVLENSLSRILALEQAHRSGSQAEGSAVATQLGEVLVTIQALEQALSELRDPTDRRRDTE